MFVRSCHNMSLTWNDASFAAVPSNMKPTQRTTQCVSLDPQREEALQHLLRSCGQQTTHDGCDAARLDRLKTLLRLMISYEGRHVGTGLVAVESQSSQASMVAAARRVDLRRYKTELCRSYAETGQCRYGVKCQFAHGADELRPLARHPRYRTELCHSFHVNGFCPYGSRCNFIHSDATAPPPPGVTEAPASGKPTEVPQPSTAFLLQHSPGNCLALKQLLKHSNDVKQRAICGRQTAAGDVCPMAVLQALDASQAIAHIKLMQDR